LLNVVSGEPVSFGDIARKVVQLTGGKTTVESLPRKSVVRHRTFDPGSLKESFPSHVPIRLEKGLGETVAALSRSR
jgi:nucleoside-diphosphate-sugar epimerase